MPEREGTMVGQIEFSEYNVACTCISTIKHVYRWQHHKQLSSIEVVDETIFLAFK